MEYKTAIKLNDKLASGIYALGQIEQRNGRPDQAARFFVRVAELEPQHLDARLSLSSLMLLAGHIHEALKYTEEALVLAPRSAAALALKAGVALRLGNRLEATQYAEAALQSDPGAGEAFMVLAAERLGSGDARGAIEHADRGLNVDKVNLPLEILRLKALEELRDEAEIESTLLRLADGFPTRPEFPLALVRRYIEMGSKGKAEALLRRYATRDATHSQTGLALVEFMRRERGVEAAKAELKGLATQHPSHLPYALALSRLMFTTGDRDGAIAFNRDLVDKYTNPAERANITVELAKMLATAERLPEAEELANSVLGHDKKNLDALIVRASVRASQRRNREALDDLRAGLNEAAQSGRILRLMAELHDRDGAVELAEEHFAKAVRADQFKADTALAYVNFLVRYGKVAQAERVLSEARAREPYNRQVLSRYAHLLLANQNWIGAQEVGDALRKLGPEDGPADQILAAALAGQSRHEDSIRLLRQSVANAADPTGPMRALVETYVRAKQPERAEEFLRAVLRDKEDNAFAHALLGWVHVTKGKVEEAETSFRRSVEHAPNLGFGHQALAHLHVSQGRFSEAQLVLRGVLKTQPGNQSAQLQLATVLEQAQDYEGAIREYEELVSADPSSTLFANNLASLLSERRSDEASLNRAYALATKLSTARVPQFLDTLGWILYRKGEVHRAVTLLKSAADGLPNNPLIHLHLGLAYKQLGQMEQAATALKKAAASEPESEAKLEAVRALEQLMVGSKT